MGGICKNLDKRSSIIQGPPIIQIIQKDYQETNQLSEKQIFLQWRKRLKKQKQLSYKQYKHKNDEDKYYCGSFQQGLPQGYALIYHVGIMEMILSFRKGLAQGLFQLNNLKQNSIVAGSFQKGKVEGKATIIKRQIYKMEAKFSNNQLDQGQYTTLDPQSCVQSACIDFKNYKAQIKYKNKRIYQGQINLQLQHDGTGKLEYAPQEPHLHYQGQWEQGKIHGKGKMQWKDGSYYEGSFIKGKKCGFGKFVDCKGKILEGYWKEGKFIKDQSQIKMIKLGEQSNSMQSFKMKFATSTNVTQKGTPRLE